MDTPTYRYASDSFPPCTRSIGAEEELWAVDPIVESTWNARRGRRRAVQNAGFTVIAALVGVLGGLAGSSSARGAMVAWGTMGAVPRPAIQEPAPVVEAPAAPAATQPVIELPVLVITAKAAPASLGRRAPAPRAGAQAYLSDPY